MEKDSEEDKTQSDSSKDEVSKSVSKVTFEKAGSSDDASQRRSTAKGVRWNVEEEDAAGKRYKDLKTQRQSLVGTSGYVSQLLGQYLEDDSGPRLEDKGRKPIRLQSEKERRESIKAIEADMEYYMKEASFPKPQKSSSFLNLSFASRSKEKSKEQKVAGAIPLPSQGRPSSEWKPSQILEEETIGEQVERSWVGTYIVGKDYWSTEEKNGENELKEIGFTMDNKRRPWYEMSLATSRSQSEINHLKSKSFANIENLKEEMDEKFEEKRKQRSISAAYARQQSTENEEWSEEFKQCFEEVSKMNNFSTRGTHISMANADKWLERAELLDHIELTLIHTGLCFLASGGNRHRGLSFMEFIHFLKMISHTCKKPLRDVVRRLTACKR